MGINLGSAYGKVGIDLSGVRSAASDFSRDMGKMEASLVSLANAARAASVLFAAGIAAMAVSAAGVATIGLRAFQSWGEQLDMLQDIFGGTNEDAAAMAVAMNRVGLTVEDGSAAFSFFVRNVEQTRTALEQSAAAVAEYREQIRNISADLSDTRITITQDTYERIKGIESSLADTIASINEALALRLEDIAHERARIDRELQKNLLRFDRDAKEQLKHAHGRERRELKKRLAEQRQDMIDAANERKADLDRQEARAKAQAERQIMMAERAAQKQIEAAEKAAEKQIAAAERAADKQIAAIERTIRKQEQQVKAGTPMLKALDALGLKFEDIDAKPFYEQLAVIMDAFKKMPEGSKAAKVALDLFGKSGFKFLDFLRSNRTDALAMAKAWGLLIDPGEAEAFSRSLNELQLRFMGLGVTIGKTLLPYAKEFLATFKRIFDEIFPVIQSTLTRLSTAFDKDGIRGLFDELGKIIEEIAKNPKVQAAVKSGMQKLGDALGWALNAALDTAIWIGTAVGKILDKIIEWLKTDTGTAKTNEAANTFGTKLQTAIELFVANVLKVGTIMALLCQKLVLWVESPEGQAWMAAIGSAIANGIIEGVKKGLGGLKGIMPPEMEFPPTGGASSFQKGGFIPRNMLAMLHAGEYVLNRGQVAALSHASAAPMVNIVHNWSGEAAAYDRRAIERIAEDAAYKGIRVALGAA